MPGPVFTRLHDLALEQHGFLRPSDVKRVGIDPKRLVDLESRGQAERVGWGIYRLNMIPHDQMEEFMLAALWPHGRGTISHETALDLYDLCDVNPHQIDVTVPRRYRITRQVPQAYRLWKEDLADTQVTRWQGVPIVTPQQAILGATDAGVRAGLIEQAIDGARARGMIKRTDADNLHLHLDRVTAG